MVDNKHKLYKKLWYAVCILTASAFVTIIWLGGRSESFAGLQMAPPPVLRLSKRENVVQYQWLNETQIFVLKQKQDATASIWNLSDHGEQQLTNATEGLRNLDIVIKSENDVQLSPQLGFLLCSGDLESNNLLNVVGLENTFTLKTPLRVGDGPVCWISESGVVQFTRGSKKAKAFEWGKTNVSKEIPISAPIGFPLKFFQKDGWFESALKEDDRLDISRIRLWPRSELLEKIEIPIERSSVLEAPEFSIDGRSLAWVDIAPSRKFEFRRVRYFPYFKIRHQDCRIVCVANIDTKSVRKLRIVSETDILCLRWMPDGKNISYMTADGIYIIPTE